MFYVAGEHIYVATYNEVLGIYPEVHIVDGAIKVLETGVSRKPAERSVCTLQEVLAQFGPNHAAAATYAQSAAKTTKAYK